MPSFLTDPDALPAADLGVGDGPAPGKQSWPDAFAYQEALQYPEAHVGCPDLARGRVARGRGGMPLTYSGRFAIVFRITLPDGTDWALRCFTTPGRVSARTLHWQSVARYSDALSSLLLPVRFLERGVRVDGIWYPAVAMPWASGEPLLTFVERHMALPETLLVLADSLGCALSRLEEAGVAHGDWQHDNLFVSEGGRTVTLVDYDGFYAPEWETEERTAVEIGHPNYQHPGRDATHYGVGSDRFASRAMRTALRALAREPSLWNRFGGYGGESLLFTREDFLGPDESRLFAEIRRLAVEDADLATALTELESDCALPAPILAPRQTLRPEVAAWARRRRSYRAANDNDSGAYSITSCRAPLSYRERLRAMEASGATRRNVARARAFVLCGGLALWVSMALTGWSFFTGMLAASFVYWFLVGNYLEWPPKRVWDALHQEMGKLGLEVAVFEERVRLLRETSGLPSAAVRSSREAASERTGARLKRVPISRVLAVPGVRRETVRQLRAFGIESAQDLRDQPLPETLRGSAEAARLQLWYQETERRFSEAHAREGAPGRFHSVQRTNLERGLAQRRRRIRELEAECALFGRVEIEVYLVSLVTGRMP